MRDLLIRLKRVKPIIIPLCIFLATPVIAAQYHIRPNGSATGSGSSSSPWDLRTALSHPAVVHPGDTLWLHGGTYSGLYGSYLQGTANAPIIVRSYPGEWAIIDNGGTNEIALWINGAYTWFWGFEVRSSNPNPPRGEAGINLGASEGTKLINLVIHDEGATALNPYSGATNAEIYGCLAYYNGREDDPLHRNGYGVYGQNAAPSKKFIMESFFFNNFGIFQVHMAGSSTARLDDITFTGNTVFGHTLYDNKNVIALYGNFEVGSGKNLNPEWSSNFFYRADLWLGYNGDGVENATLTNNYFFRGGVTENAGNTYRAKSGNVVTTTGNQVFVRPNKYADQYEPRRANIIVFNGSGASSVTVPLPVGVLSVGDRYEIRDVQNFFGAPVDTGTYGGGAIAVRMPGSSDPIATPRSIPVNRPGSSLPAHTSNEFGAFILIANGSSVVPSTVTGSLSTNPVSLPAGGGSVMLSWSSQNATSASIDQGIGSVATSGSRSVQVNASTVFTLTLNGPGGPVTSQASVQVATTGLVPGMIPLIAPVNNASVSSDTVKCVWSNSPSSWDWFEISTDSLFVSSTSVDSAVMSCTKVVRNLRNNTPYYWRVRGGNLAGWGPFSPIWSFSTLVNKTGSPFPVNLQGSPPEENTIAVTVAKAAGMDSAYISMRVYDADGASEGMLYVNGVDSLILFGSIAAPARDNVLTEFMMRMSATAWKDGENSLRFAHTSTGGFRIDSVAVLFGKRVSDVELVGTISPVYALAQNYPNPFNPRTTISFSVTRSGKATVTVCNLLGQKIATLFDGFAEPGRMYKTSFEASKLASGVYLYRLEAEGKASTKKMILAK